MTTSSKLLTESTAPLVRPFQEWKVEWVEPEGLTESLAESVVKQFEQQLEESGNKSILENWGQLRDDLLQELKSIGSQRRLRVSGPAQIVGERNQNGRVYPGDLWDRVLSPTSMFVERLNNRTVLGECEHPDDGNTKLPRVSHLVERVWREGAVINATHLIFRTPTGQIVEELFNNGCSPGVSSRGTGSTRRENGDDIVEADGYVLDTWDFVYNPSVSIARPKVESVQTVADTVVQEDRKTIRLSSASSRDQVIELADAVADVSTVTYEKKQDCLTLVGAESSLKNFTDQLEVKGLKYKEVDESEISESADGDLSTGVSEESEGGPQRHIVGSVPNKRNEAMTTALKEAADRTAAARAILDESGRVLDGDADLNSLLEQHEKVSGTLSELSKVISEEYADDKSKLQGALTERASQLRREIDRIRKAVVENVPVDPSQPVTEAKDKTKSVSQVTDVIEELATRNRRLRESSRGKNSVPAKKFETAIELGQGLVDRFEEHREKTNKTIADLRKQLRESKKRQEAAVKLLESVVTRYRTNDVKQQVEALVAANPALETIKETLIECENIGELNRIVEKVIAPLSSNSRTNRRSDLPPIARRRTQPITETRDQPTTNNSSNLMEAVLERHGYR